MALAIIVCNAFISAGLPTFTGTYADWAKMTFTIGGYEEKENLMGFQVL